MRYAFMVVGVDNTIKPYSRNVHGSFSDSTEAFPFSKTPTCTTRTASVVYHIKRRLVLQKPFFKGSKWL